MIKGVDSQIMTQRTMDYQKDMSAHLRRDELNNNILDKLNKQETERELYSVAKNEQTRNKRIGDDAQKNKQGKDEEEKKKSPEEQLEALTGLDEDEARWRRFDTPGVGAAEKKLLDIEV